MALRSSFARLLRKQADAGLQLPKQAHSVALVGAPLSRGQVGIAAEAGGGARRPTPCREGGQAGAAAVRSPSPRRGWRTWLRAAPTDASLFSLSHRNGGEWTTAPLPSAPRGWWSGWPGSVRNVAASGASPVGRGGGGDGDRPHLPGSLAGHPFRSSFGRSVTQPLAASPGGWGGVGWKRFLLVNHETQNAPEVAAPGGRRCLPRLCGIGKGDLPHTSLCVP